MLQQLHLNKCPTLSGVSKLSTHHSGISAAPVVITHSAPHIVYTDLHSAFIGNVTSQQFQLTSSAWSCIMRIGADVQEQLHYLAARTLVEDKCKRENTTFTPNTRISRVKTVMCQDWPARTLQ